MIEDRLWLPVLAAGSLAADTPSAARVLGRDRVLWRTPDGGVAAAPDRCPHRGTALSLGAVRDGALVCPYHGWSFASDGRCLRIPAVPQAAPGARHGLPVLDAREHLGLVWVREGAPHEALALREPPAFALPERPGVRRLLCGPYDVATSSGRLMENFLDLAHFAFVHPGTLGDPAHAAIGDHQVETLPGFAGVIATGCEVWQPRSNLLADDGARVRYRYEVRSPFAALLAKCPEGWQDYEESIALFVLPVEPERSRAWFLIAMSAGGRSDAQIRAFQDAIFEEDRRILESQRPAALPLDPQAELSCAADRLSLAWRAWLRALGVGFGVLGDSPPEERAAR